MDFAIEVPARQPWTNTFVELENDNWQFERERIYEEREVVEEDVPEVNSSIIYY